MKFACFAMLISVFWLQAQTDSIQKFLPLKEVIVSSSRIDIPFSKNARTIQIISSDKLEATGAISVAEALQQIVGVDIRRRGVAGTQADLYIRGGSFDQTLLLIDGIKLDDAQTGHHTLNFLPPIETIARVEIIKGPGARIFGQNAFTGVINIVTKKEIETGGSVQISGGSFGQVQGDLSLSKKTENGGILANFSRQTSDGYRFNTDFKNHTAFIKASIAENKGIPLEGIAFFSGRKFGANGFYASPEAREQYEETEASLLAVKSKIQKGNWILKPNIYWRRGQDHYLFLRSQPEVYENWHLTHKVGAALNSSYTSSWGVTGLGFDISRVSIASNNLGDRLRGLATFFLEQHFSLGNRLDLTPGVAVNIYSDFGVFTYPGIDLGFHLNQNWHAYGNLGYTYRIPTYTDLFYKDRTTQGNADLVPEQALAIEFGIRYNIPTFHFYTAYFDRRAENLIDYIKAVEGELWKATNIRDLNSRGFETEIKIPFIWNKYRHHFQVGYTYLTDDLEALFIRFSRYSINSLKHHFTASYEATITSKLKTFLGFKYGQRPEQEGYAVLDASLIWNLRAFQLQGAIFNVLNQDYTETNLVPMPGRNGRISLKYEF